MHFSVIDLLFPPRCIICRKITGHGISVCADCAHTLPLATGHEKQTGDFFDACFAPLFYQEPLRASFLRYKFGGKTYYAGHYAKWMVDCIRRNREETFDCVTWVPLSRRRRLRRGYDQAELLAGEIALQLGIPLRSTLKKAHRTPLSAMKGERALRAAHILGAYTLKKGAGLQGQHVLLVDDVTTSGATLSECARMLLLAGAERVTCLTLARRAD